MISKNESIEKLFDKKIDLRKTAIVEMNDSTLSAKNYVIGNAAISTYTANKVVVDTHNSGEGFLVLLDSYYPTWKAKICNKQESECKETSIYITNYNFRGIVIPAGNYHVVFYNSLL